MGAVVVQVTAIGTVIATVAGPELHRSGTSKAMAQPERVVNGGVNVAPSDRVADAE